MLNYPNLFIALLLFFCCYATYTDLRERKIKNFCSYGLIYAGILSQVIKQLHPSINTERIDELFNIAKANGCSGGKVCGAGGGGCLVFHCEPDRIHAAKRVFSEVGAHVIPFRFDFQGLRTWSPQ